jgi:hypothetical protein
MESKPGPRFALVAGTETFTLLDEYCTLLPSSRSRAPDWGGDHIRILRFVMRLKRPRTFPSKPRERFGHAFIGAI